MTNDRELARAIVSEVGTVLERVETAEVERLVTEILQAEKVFLFAVGRVFLSLQCFGKRLGHLGIDCQIVGAVNERPITPADLLLIASGSGESRLPVTVAQIARSKQARLGLITSARASTLRQMSDFAVHLPCPTKNDPDFGVHSVQAMSTLFDQALHLFGDEVAMAIQQRKGLRTEELWRYHANLE